jgi:hypothetical protein
MDEAVAFSASVDLFQLDANDKRVHKVDQDLRVKMRKEKKGKGEEKSTLLCIFILVYHHSISAID